MKELLLLALLHIEVTYFYTSDFVVVIISAILILYELEFFLYRDYELLLDGLRKWTRCLPIIVFKEDQGQL